MAIMIGSREAVARFLAETAKKFLQWSNNNLEE